MSSEVQDAALITLMHELKRFVRQSLEQPEVMNELRHWMMPAITGRFGPTKATADEIIRAFELLAPGLMVDFLAENPEILNSQTLAEWAAFRDALQRTTAEATA
ncbi:MAG TPA: hypothetical protein VE783_00305 [Candidatus Limnocylindrales bacterium]|jgi:hypothetical protein|nr:hypothetical protein [Candidatus Limnocylindrales bacterium]